MNLTEIKHMIANLVNYRDSDITHTLASRFTLSYSKQLSSFQIRDIENDIIHRYEELETAALALFNMIHNLPETIYNHTHSFKQI
ncbi:MULTISPECIES: hypothetical protein [Priestia]|jgi:hypothetical protein|nr:MULTISPECIES: hypothetical protein [Priestia]MBK0005715.1 hypothetical protein [Bacillus sp. S35]SDD32229.1 hypothetical protein SAMN04487777_103407 [Priestia aryabhattai B8W22]MCM3252146.1 hypothetical protein [Priestia aryabhattai]MCM3642144.1 hypothetical protein [Priestia aryabhattai]PFW74706.1 hypothetical protein COL23_17215 [Priestia aryabhattai]